MPDTDTRRVRPHLLAALPLLLLTASLAAARPGDACAAAAEARRFREVEAARLQNRLEILRSAEAGGVQPSQPVDVQRYLLELRIDPSQRNISGVLTMTFSPTQPLSRLRMRLHPALNVSTVQVDDVVTSRAAREGANILFSFNPALAPGTTHLVALTYAGPPQNLGSIGGGFMYSSHQGTASATTLSEPFASYAWWPCVDDVTDKSTAEIRLTVPPGMVGASIGSLVSITTGQDGWRTYDWVESYPVANYLISANVTNYSEFADYYQSLDGSVTMDLSYFFYPEWEGQAILNVARVPDMIHTFAQLCGEYPFLREKYGMVAFPWDGGMEHQTLTSMGDGLLGGRGNYDGIYAHELAHQWWGDDVTCATWNDIWLNEGFATYFEALWIARAYGMDMGDVLDQYYDDHRAGGTMAGPVYRSSGNNPFGDTGAVYDKGAWVLHMLRNVMGEVAFWDSLADYQASHRYGNARTQDLQAACEARYGASLAWFFDQWLYTPKRPVYHVSFTAGPGSVTLTVAQRQGQKVAHRTADRNVYIMPADIALHFEDGTSETHAVTNDQRSQAFTFEVSKRVVAVGFDENHRILKVVR